LKIFDKGAYRELVESFKGKEDEHGFIMNSLDEIFDYMSRTSKIAKMDTFEKWYRIGSRPPKMSNILAMEKYFNVSLTKVILSNKEIIELSLFIVSVVLVFVSSFFHKNEMMSLMFLLLLTGLYVVFDNYGNARLNKAIGSSALLLSFICGIFAFV